MVWLAAPFSRKIQAGSKGLTQDWLARKWAAAALATASIGVIALIDSRVEMNLGFAFLYLFPVVLIASVLPRWYVLLAALLCTCLADYFDPFPFTLNQALPQDILVFTSLSGVGLLAYEVTRRRRGEHENLLRIEKEAIARRAAEEQLEFLIDSSPAAILTMTAGGEILLANAAAHRLFGLAAGQLPGRTIGRYIPALARVPSVEHSPQAFRTEMQCRGEREDGGVFLANVFFSTYRTAAGPRLAALVVDGSEELREREESSLQQLMAGSRILVGAVSHEIRNVCGAIAVIHENLSRTGILSGNKDFEALGAMVETLHRIASLELKQGGGEPRPEAIDLAETMEDLRIVLEPVCRDVGIEVRWDVPTDLPRVWADRHRLLQVLLNLTKNSERALENAETKTIEVSARASGKGVTIRVVDTGPGIASPDALFQPFQKGAESTGLGLYLSRAFVRSFHGELRYEPGTAGCAFAVELAAAGVASERARAEEYGTHPTPAGR
jgi:two-component system sensor kinase FixL